MQNGDSPRGVSEPAFRESVILFLSLGMVTSVGTPMPEGRQGTFTLMGAVNPSFRLAVTTSESVPERTRGVVGGVIVSSKGASSTTATVSRSLWVVQKVPVLLTSM